MGFGDPKDAVDGGSGGGKGGKKGKEISQESAQPNVPDPALLLSQNPSKKLPSSVPGGYYQDHLVDQLVEQHEAEVARTREVRGERKKRKYNCDVGEVEV